MNTESRITLTLHETCHVLDLDQHYLIEIIETGIVEPYSSPDPEAETDDNPEHWRFDADMLSLLQRAQRLSRELHLDWSATAIIVGLMEENEQLERQNRQLQQQLQRFIQNGD